MLKLGDIGFKDLRLGNIKIKKAYLGDNLLYNPQHVFLEYLENTSGAYIKTGLKPSYDYTYKIKYQYTKLSNTFNPIFGMRTSVVGTGNNLFWAGMHYTDKQAYLRFGGNSVDYALGDKALDIIEMTCSPEGIFINGEDTGARYYDGTIATNALEMYLFTLNNQGEPDGGLGYTNARVYSYEVYDGDMNLIQELIPCISPSGKVGMYDTVTSKYFYNQGSGEFKAGYIPLDYVNFDGASYIDTGIIPSNNMEFEAGVMFSVVQSTNLSIISSRDGEKRYQPIGAIQNKWSASIGGMYDENGSPVSADIRYDLRSVVSNGDSISLYSGDTLVSSATSSGGIPTKSLYLFARNYSPIDSYVTGSLYYCKIWDNGVLVQDLRPCIHPTTKQVGFYDLVTNQYFFNAGKGTLKAGGKFVKSILFDGASYIDTGITQQTCKVECGIKFANADTRQLIGFHSSNAGYWGCRNDSGRYEASGGLLNTTVSALDYNDVVIDYNCDDVTAPFIRVTVKDVTASVVGTAVFATKNYTIGALITSSAIPLYHMTGQVYYNKFYIGGELVQDLRPYVDEDGVACFKDLVTGDLFYNQGTGTLTFKE